MQAGYSEPPAVFVLCGQVVKLTCVGMSICGEEVKSLLFPFTFNLILKTET